MAHDSSLRVIHSSLTTNIIITGPLDDECVQRLRGLSLALLDVGRRRLRVDASEATFVDGAALDHLVATAALTRHHGGLMTVCGVERGRMFRPRAGVAT